MIRYHVNTIVAALALAAPLVASAQPGPIRVGVVTPLSGTYAGIGQQVSGAWTSRPHRSTQPAA